MEKRNQVFYVRTRPSIKTYLEKRMKKDGFDSMADWFEQWILSIKKRDTKRANNKRKLQ